MGESFYLDRPTRDLRGVLADNRVYEVDANEVRGYSLSEALRKLDKKEDRMVEEKWKPIMAGRKRKAEEEPELEGTHMLVTQKTPGIVARALPQTTCYLGINCDHKGQPELGTYRFSLEPRGKAMSATRPIGYRGVVNLSTFRRSPSLMGCGKGGEIWICLTCYEGLLDDKLYRNVFGDEKVNEQRLRRCLKNIVDTWQREDPQAVFLPGQPIFEIAYWILGDQRVIPNRAGKFTLRSFKIYGIELWKARRLWYRRDASPDYVLATAHEQLKALLTAARKLAENSAVGARRAEYLQKINEKDGTRPPPESPKKAPNNGDNILRISSFPTSDALIPGQNEVITHIIVSLTYADVRIVAEYTPNESIIEKELASTSTNNFIHGVTPAPILTTGTVIRESAPPAAISSIKTSPKRKWQGQQLVNVEEVDLNGGGAGEVVVVFQGRGTMAAVAGDIIEQ
ncbi:MAG: hypothetical protein ASARMPRED_000584 [Alectoria sarmentosa]|nr:MAG: hypothetical protein ASARMPRED_000584 [Alectoria sarmentosa]